MNSVPNCSHTAVLFVGQKTTFQPNLTHQRQIAPIHTRSSGCVFQGGSGERLHGMQEVTGSIPVFSTKKALYFVGSMVLFFFLKPVFGGLHCFVCTVFRLLQAVPIQPPMAFHKFGTISASLSSTLPAPSKGDFNRCTGKR